MSMSISNLKSNGIKAAVHSTLAPVYRNLKSLSQRAIRSYYHQLIPFVPLIPNPTSITKLALSSSLPSLHPGLAPPITFGKDIGFLQAYESHMLRAT